MSSEDPTVTDPHLYRVIFENDRVRVLEYRDRPGEETCPHRHPDSVMYTLSSFQRRISQGDRCVDVEIPAGSARGSALSSTLGRTSGPRRPTASSWNSRSRP